MWRYAIPTNAARDAREYLRSLCNLPNEFRREITGEFPPSPPPDRAFASPARRWGVISTPGHVRQLIANIIANRRRYSDGPYRGGRLEDEFSPREWMDTVNRISWRATSLEVGTGDEWTAVMNDARRRLHEHNRRSNGD